MLDVKAPSAGAVERPAGADRAGPAQLARRDLSYVERDRVTFDGAMLPANSADNASTASATAFP